MTRQELKIEGISESILKSVLSVFPVDYDCIIDKELDAIIEHDEKQAMHDSIRKQQREIRNNDFEAREKGKAVAISKDYAFQLACRSSEELMTKTNDFLSMIASEIGAKKTGNKKDLIKQIKSRVHDLENQGGYHVNTSVTESLSVIPIIDGYIVNHSFASDNEAIKIIENHIFENKIDNMVIIGMINSIARNRGYINGKDACEQIIRNHYQEEIFFDISQGIRECILLEIRRKNVMISHGKVTWLNDAFSRLYSGLYQVLQDNKAVNIRRNHENVFSYYDESGTLEKIVALNEKNAIPILAKHTAIDDILSDETLKSFIRFMRVRDEKHFSRLFGILSDLLQGMNQEEIAEKRGIKQRMVRNNIVMIRELMHDFKQDIVPVKNQASGFDGCTHRKSDESASGSYNFRYQTIGSLKDSFGEMEYTQEFLDDYLEKNAYFFNIRKAISEKSDIEIEAEKAMCDKHVYRTLGGKTLIFIGGKCVSEK